MTFKNDDDLARVIDTCVKGKDESILDSFLPKTENGEYDYEAIGNLLSASFGTPIQRMAFLGFIASKLKETLSKKVGGNLALMSLLKGFGANKPLPEFLNGFIGG